MTAIRMAVAVIGTGTMLCAFADDPVYITGAEYTLDGSGVTLRADIAAQYTRDARFVLPVILRGGARFTLSGNAAADGLLTVTSLTPLSTSGLIFALSPGFEAEELWTKPDAQGRIEIRIE